jgi:Flp pilus assembly protein TadG
MNRILNHRNRNERGMAAVEFALVLPIAMLLVAAIIELGTAFYRQQILTGAVREAARIGALAADPRATEGEIVSTLTDFLSDAGLDGATASVSVSGAGGASGEALTVSATYPTSTGFLSSMLTAAHSTYGSSGGTMPSILTLEARISAELE